ncbi:related to transcription initiation factor IID 250K chain splice form 2 [Cephalotrichum gorgonifer]|uniref:Related to transcription initiation factor IID 250K chain splice form 2 n=1 Tax=Cephalotrichum gorgonifer TaxID=2041049 RepID=A0AAE8SV09_9PEZI|nr:related to transcription initiation factor IID 250K chain splice form 2 [Cephalotrichum gorgonifer]
MSPEGDQTQPKGQAEPSTGSPLSDGDRWKDQDAADEADIRRILSQSQDMGGGQGGLNLASFSHDNPIDQSGKADDAEDFEDISDDDLPDEEPPTAHASLELPGLTDDGGTSHDTDDLFGEGRESSPFDPVLGPSSPQQPPEEPDTGYPTIRPETSFADNNEFSFDADAQEGLNQDPNIPPAIESVEDFVKQAWPQFKQGVILPWNELLAPRPAEFRAAKPTKKPKPLLITKLSLDIAPDHEKIFRVPGYSAPPRTSKDAASSGLVHIVPPGHDAGTNNEGFDLDAESDDEPICGLTLQHIDTICYDFEEKIASAEDVLNAETESREAERKHGHADADDEWDAIFMNEPAPKRKRVIPSGLPDVTQYNTPSLDSFEQLARIGAKRVLLDLNDPNLHVQDEEAEPPTKRPRVASQGRRTANGNFGLKSLRRFNIANDEAYELLKEAHQDKVRATIGNIVVDHALPALRLTWPYYKTKLAERQDQFHRPPFRVRKYVGRSLEFSKRGVVKKKAQKGKARDVFRQTKDLTMKDNSTAVLFEYCERMPTVLSKFGMGNRIINYYRKRPDEDRADPEKKLLGELQILLPEDRSPFAIFGTVDPGETVPTLHNQMFRAPLFQHKPREGDFILGRSSTGKEGAQWYLRKMDHIFTVGQTFPSVEVPGPHSRKVTTTSKNRTKMLSYRIMRRHPEGMLFTSDITKHLAGTNDGQNRQKLKEFLKYVRPDKDNNKPGYWALPPDQPLMNEEGIRALIKPEDTCLIDGMNMGMKMLEDAGFDPRLAVIQENEDVDFDGDGGKGGKKGGEKAEESLAERLAPWKTSKAFIDACTGKAMLQLHGEGDPTGHGLGFSFIRTSMKGGYLEQLQNGPLSSSADAIEKQKRDNNGHAYNVKKQEQAYKSGIREIWGKQKTTLSDPTVHDDDDVLQIADEDDRFANTQGAPPTPAAAPDDSVSQLSGFTSASRQSRKRLRIVRTVMGVDGNTEEVVEVVEDPVVISQYIKRRNEMEAADRDILQIAPTGDANMDRAIAKKIQTELGRLEKNRERRLQREQNKKLQDGASAMSPDAAPQDKPITGTTRKCANCGQVGHIKTNKKLCPLLNGTVKPNASGEQGGFGGFNAATPLSAASPPM